MPAGHTNEADCFLRSDTFLKLDVHWKGHWDVIYRFVSRREFWRCLTSAHYTFSSWTSSTTCDVWDWHSVTLFMPFMDDGTSRSFRETIPSWTLLLVSSGQSPSSCPWINRAGDFPAVCAVHWIFLWPGTVENRLLHWFSAVMPATQLWLCRGPAWWQSLWKEASPAGTQFRSHTDGFQLPCTSLSFCFT